MFYALLVFVCATFGSGSGTCIRDACENSTQCDTCAVVHAEHYIFELAPYSCYGAVPGFTPPRTGRCEVDRSFALSDAFRAMQVRCRRTRGCCDPTATAAAQLRQCSLHSCRVPTGCTYDGVCVYELDNPAVGNTVSCCDRDDDCPPFAPPHYWDATNVPPGEQLCTRARCNTQERSCVYVRADSCCAADTPDCDTFVNPQARCSRGACVYNAHLSAALGINPYTDAGMSAISAQIAHALSLFGDDPMNRVASTGGRNPLQCESRLAATCGCTRDADCTVFDSPCARATCVVGDAGERRCEVEAIGGPNCCLESVDDCVDLHDSCALPVACDAQATQLHNDGGGGGSSLVPRGELLLPTFACSYVRRELVATCCGGDADCAKLAAENECVRPVCTPVPLSANEPPRRCELSKAGFDFMGGKYRLPCCYTTGDCYADGGELADTLRAAASTQGDAGSCTALVCTGDDTSLVPAMRHKCVPRFYDVCPQVGESVRDATEASAQLSHIVLEGNEDVLPFVSAVSCETPLMLRLDASIDLTETAFQAAPYPGAISVVLDAQAGSAVPNAAARWVDALLAVTAHDTAHLTLAYPAAQRRVTVDDLTPSASIEALFNFASTERTVVRKLDVEVRLFFNATLLAALTNDEQSVGGGGSILKSHVRVHWRDGSLTTLSVQRVFLADTLSVLNCPSGDTIRAETAAVDVQAARLQALEQQFVIAMADTPAPTPPPTPYPTPYPTPEPTFAPYVATCDNSLDTTRHCDALPSTCATGISGTCLTGTGKCLSTVRGNVPIPLAEQRDTGSIFAPILDTNSWCWAQAGECTEASETSCQCRCGCISNDYLSNCVDGPLILSNDPPTLYITPQPTKLPTPLPVLPEPTKYPSPAPTPPTPAPPQCGARSAFCALDATCYLRAPACDETVLTFTVATFPGDTCDSDTLAALSDNMKTAAAAVYAVSNNNYYEISATCEAYSFSVRNTGSSNTTVAAIQADLLNAGSTFLTYVPQLQPGNNGASGAAITQSATTYCVGGCGFERYTACSTYAQCSARECCGCAASSGGYAVCTVSSASITESPTHFPTAAPLVPGTPTNAPTKEPTPYPTPPSPAPTPQPTSENDTQGQYNTDTKSCVSRPFEREVSPNYNDTLYVTYFDVAYAPEEGCLGCAYAFTNDACRPSCVRAQGVDYSYVVNVTLENRDTDSAHTLPEGSNGEGERPAARDGVLVFVEVHGCNEQIDSHKCTSLVIVDDSFEVVPLANAHYVAPSASVHSVHGAAKAFVVARAASLPTFTRLKFQVRVEGCASVQAACFKVTARLVNGRCEKFLDDWRHCRPHMVDNGIEYDYRKCTHSVTTVVRRAETPCLPVCPPLPPSASALSARHDAFVKSQHTLLELDAQTTSLPTVTKPGVVVWHAAPAAWARLSNPDACVHSLTDGLTVGARTAFSCTRPRTPEILRCKDTASPAQVYRYAVNVQNAVGSNSSGVATTISGTLHIETERVPLAVEFNEYDIDEAHVCEDFMAMYAFTKSAAEIKLKVKRVERGDDSVASAQVHYENVAPNASFTAYVYVLLCDSADVVNEPTLLKTVAYVVDESRDEHSNGEAVRCRGLHDNSYARCVSRVEAYTGAVAGAFDCAELALDAETRDLVKCHEGDESVPCAYRVYQSSLHASVALSVTVVTAVAVAVVVLVLWMRYKLR